MRRAVRGIIAIAATLAVLFVAWIAFDTVTRPLSTLMLGRMATDRPVDRRWVSLDDISRSAQSAVILSEDGQFCRNRGVDWVSLRSVLLHGHGRPSRGASTLTMQVAKNLFLWPGRSYVRKAIEIPLALVLDIVWSKQRILEIYFNIAEWGDGIFGIEAAAQHYFHTSAGNLTNRQSVLLATALPDPLDRPADRPTRLHRILADRLARLLPDATGHTHCLD